MPFSEAMPGSSPQQPNTTLILHRIMSNSEVIPGSISPKVPAWSNDEISQMQAEINFAEINDLKVLVSDSDNGNSVLIYDGNKLVKSGQRVDGRIFWS